MRGKVGIIRDAEGDTGITPAYAGKSIDTPEKYALTEDHPRVCGEKMLPTASAVGVVGSPPRMRGKVGIIRDAEGDTGITPAYAGKSIDTPEKYALTEDHPRVCGEKISAIQA